MRRNPASLNRRLLLAAGAFIALALMLAAFVIAFLLQRFITGQIDGRLDTQIVFLSSMLHESNDGAIALTGAADGPPFAGPPAGWYWEVVGPRNILASRSLAGRQLDVPPFRLPPRGDHPAPADAAGPGGAALHFRIQPQSLNGIPVVIVATAPRTAITAPLHEAMRTLALSLAALGAALVGAMVLQVRLGLRPLDRLRAAVAEVRAGRRERLDDAQPLEVQPLVAELNALLAQNAATLERARAHVANLAHGLKTPLATLSLALAEREGGGDLHALVAQIERRIRHHLGRARAAALSGPARAQTPLARLSDLVAVLGKIHAERGIAVTQSPLQQIALACEQQDFDEMAGNLLDNAFKWAATRIAIEARRAEGRLIAIAIEDDGPGIPPRQIADALLPGARGDETAPGFGFGLSITRELAELYGGGIELGIAPAGGLKATLRLPLALTPAATAD